MTALTVQDLHARYSGTQDVLEGVGFSVDLEEVVGLVGRNGAGKTTLMRIAMGMLVPSAGSVQVLGLDPRRDPVRVKSSVGYVAGDGMFQVTGDDSFRDMTHQFIPLAVYMLFAMSGPRLVNMQFLDVLPVSRRRVFALLVTPSLVVFLLGFGAARALAPSTTSTPGSTPLILAACLGGFFLFSAFLLNGYRATRSNASRYARYVVGLVVLIGLIIGQTIGVVTRTMQPSMPREIVESALQSLGEHALVLPGLWLAALVIVFATYLLGQFALSRAEFPSRPLVYSLLENRTRTP